MANRRMEMHRLQDLVRLHRKGMAVHSIARELGMSPTTERRYREVLQKAGVLGGPVEELPELARLMRLVKEAMPTPQPSAHEVSSAAEWREDVEALLKKGLRPRAIHDRLRLQEEEYGASYWSIKRLCRSIRREKGIRPEDVAIPVSTGPGEVAQVDFGYVGRLYDPSTESLRRAWVFVMTLGYSRHMVARVVFDQRGTTWLGLHVEAFEELGGVVEVVVPDNLKAAVIRAAFSTDDTELNRGYRELARHYDLRIDPTPPRAPRKKGKVESSVKYAKSSFFRGREGEDVTKVRAELARWVKEIAGQRIHGTTGRKPLEVFETEEAAALKALPETRYELVEWKKAKVHRDIHVAFERRLYSVPFRYVGRESWIRATPREVVVYVDNEVVAQHDRKGPRFRSTVEAHLPEHRRDYRHRTRAYWERRAAALDPEVGAYIRDLFDSDEVLSQLRKAQATVKLLEGYPVERARRACRRAAYFGSYSYLGVKNILRRALDLQPLPEEEAASSPPLQSPRYARRVGDLLPFPER